MLRYTNLAHDWNEALPVGNGRMGAMVYGGVHTEILRLNEESVWYGGPLDRTPHGAKDHLQELRGLIREGKQRRAEDLVKRRFLASPKSARHYEPLGTCKIAFAYGPDKIIADGSQNTFDGYERTLDLENAQANVRYRVNGTTVSRTIIATHVDNVIAIRVSAENSVSFLVGLNRKSDVDWEVNEFLDSMASSDDRIIMHATPGGKESNSLCLAVGARVESGEGSVRTVGHQLEVTAKDALIVIASNTTYRHADIEATTLADIEASFKHTASDIWQRHLDDWRSRYNRMGIDLYPNAASLPTNERLKSDPDPGLAALYHAYSRYLLLSCSRTYPKALPATLQGIWNPYFQPPWGSKFTININLQMNYWPAHVSNLSECEYPFFDLLERMSMKGRKTASEVWGCRGWCAHHCTDIFADTETQDCWMPATLWPLGGAWMSTHIWEHYTFTHDKQLLRRMMPVLEGCVQFLLDFLTPDATGAYLVTNPSLSPENSFRHRDSGEVGVFCEGSTIDTQIVRTVFENFIAASKLKDAHPDLDLVSQAQRALERLPPTMISPENGTIQEWGMTVQEEVELGHRHISQLYGLHPGNSITPELTPSLAEAAKKTILRRLEHGGGHTGWSRAWLINMWARLREPQNCEQNLHALLRHSTLPNMLDTHPPFQIDGNFGGGAAIVECLVQSHEFHFEDGAAVRVLRLLPSCPKSWQKGTVHGVKARGGFELSFSWEAGRVSEPVTVKSEQGTSGLLIVHNVGSDTHDAGIRVVVPGHKGVHSIYLTGSRGPD